MTGEPTTATEERALARLIARGDRDAIRRLVLPYGLSAAGEARRWHRTLGRDDAAGVATLALVEAARGYSGRGRFWPVARTMVRLALRRAARRAMAARRFEAAPAMRADPAAPAQDERPDAVAAVRSAVAMLDGRDRAEAYLFLETGGRSPLRRAVRDRLRRHLSR